MTNAADSETPAAEGFVRAECPPARSDVPEAVPTPRGLLALPLMVVLWHSPKRAGRWLAAAGWKAALAAHVLATTTALGLIVWNERFYMLNPFAGPANYHGVEIPARQMTLSEYARAPWAAIVLAAHSASVSGGGAARIVLLIGCAELGLLVLAAAMMPFAAAGEAARPLFGRCLRLTWWSTTIFFLLGAAWLASPRLLKWLHLPEEWHPVHVAGLALFAAWWLFVLLRSGYRYAGSPQGPAWELRTPRCETCGYTIAHLLLSTKCPECGRPVADSLPERRSVPAFARATSFGERWRAFRATLHSVCYEAKFFERLAIHQGHETARTFFLAGCLVDTALIAGTGLALERATAPGEAGRPLLAAIVVIACAVWLAQVIVSGLLAVLIAAVGRRPLQPTAVVMFYALSALVPITARVALLIALGIIGAVLLDRRHGSLGTEAASAGMGLLALVVAISLVWRLPWMVQTVRRALRHTRFANA